VVRPFGGRIRCPVDSHSRRLNHRKFFHFSPDKLTLFHFDIANKMTSSSSFKSIEPVPNGTDFLDIVLSRTQRRLPTVIRPGFKISRIRAFYARKVKYTQESFSEKLESILTQFPRLDSIHPFHADLVSFGMGL
jgi:NOG1 N-terminal helical domain